MQLIKHNRLLAAAVATTLLAGTTMFAGMASAVGPEVTTLPATSVSSSDATINGMNGDTDASGTAFWVSTSTFSVASSSSPTLPDGVYGTGDLGPVASTTGFSAELSDATIPSGLMPITSDTTYYYAAWVNIGGVWYPGDVLSVSTLASSSPTISNVTVESVGTSSATISWDTDLPATSQVNYGTTTSYGSSSAFDSTLTTEHMVELLGLDEDTLYHVQVESGNTVGTTTATTTLTTATSTATSTPLAIDDTEAVDTGGIANGEWDDGWEWVITFTVPEDETQFQMRFTDFMSDDDSFDAGGNIRYFTSESSSATTSDDAIVVDDANEYGDAITLDGDSDDGTAGRQVEVHVQVKIPFGTPEGSYSTTFQAQTDTP